MTSQNISDIATSAIWANCTDARDMTVELYFKCENLQRTGSFKFRGASHFLARLEDHELENGVVAYSTGTSAA
jgi:threonine dehydratase